MRKVLSCDGMETHLSLMLLISASLLITAFSLSIGHHQGKDRDLFEVRSLQAGCIVSCIQSYEAEYGRGPFVQQLPDDGLPLCIIWTGTEAVVLEGMPQDVPTPLLEVLASTPDGLGCLVLIGHEDVITLNIKGSAVVRCASIDDVTTLTVALPLVRGGASYREVVF